jgi:inhibitor of KinA
MPEYAIYSLGDQAVTLTFGEEINDAHHRRVLRLEHALRGNQLPGLKDIVIAYSSITIYYDASVVQRHVGSDSAFAYWKTVLEEAVSNEKPISYNEPALVRIPVCYEKAYAPDMEHVCETLRLTADEVVGLHTRKIYTVYMIGFLPGFPYMGTVDERLRISRRDKPRQRIAAGSVGLAGIQTGIYPMDSPGGWQIIGRTPVVMFDRHAQIPAFLSPGDRIQFFSISSGEYLKHDHSRS